MDETISITFENVELAEAGRLALELKEYLHNVDSIESIIEKEKANTQDFGSILTIILGSTSTTLLIKALSNWLLKRQSRKISIKKDGQIIGENLSSGDIKEILEFIKK